MTRLRLSVLAGVSLGLLALTQLRADSFLRCTGAKLWERDSAAESKLCLSCHDGVLASDRMPKAWENLRMGQIDHPVEISYLAAYLANRDGLIPPSLVDRRLRLVNGNIECVTCHVASSAGGGFLTMKNGRDRLCVSCHVK